MEVTEIIADFKQHSKSELKIMLAAINMLLRKDEGPGPLYPTLLASVGKDGVPFGDFKLSRAYRAWRDNEPLLLEWIQQHWPRIKLVERRSLENYLFQLLVNDLRDRAIRITLGTVAINAGEIPAIFDHQFPGYLNSGLAHLILKKLVNGHAKEERAS